MTITPQQQQALDAALAAVQVIGPALGTGGAAASAIATAAVAAIRASGAAATDVSDAQLAAIFNQYTANQLDDAAAQKAAKAAGDTSGT